MRGSTTRKKIFALVSLLIWILKILQEYFFQRTCYLVNKWNGVVGCILGSLNLLFIDWKYLRDFPKTWIIFSKTFGNLKETCFDLLEISIWSRFESINKTSNKYFEGILEAWNLYQWKYIQRNWNSCKENGLLYENV